MSKKRYEIIAAEGIVETLVSRANTIAEAIKKRDNALDAYYYVYIYDTYTEMIVYEDEEL